MIRGRFQRQRGAGQEEARSVARESERATEAAIIEAREIRSAQEAAARDAAARRARVEREVIAPLVRTRRKLLEQNHIREELERLLGGA